MASGILIVKTEKLPKIINQPSICFNDVSEILNEVKRLIKLLVVLMMLKILFGP
jgi:hypothetical protein